MISFFDLSLDPVSERLANYGSSHVGYPLFGKTVDLLMVLGKVLVAHWMIAEKLQNTFDGKRVILRYIDLLDVLLFDTY